MMEKAQDNKKKHNLEGKQVNCSKTSPQTCKVPIANIAAEIGVVSRDGSPLSQSMLESMLEVEQQRISNFEKIYKQNAIAKIDSTSVDIISSSNNLSKGFGQNMLVNDLGGNQCGTPDTQIVSQSLSSNINNNNEGWTEVKVGRKRKRLENESSFLEH